MGPEFTQVIRPLDTRGAGEEKHISFLNGVFNSLEEEEEEEEGWKPKKKFPHFLRSPTDSFPAHGFALHHHVSEES